MDIPALFFNGKLIVNEADNRHLPNGDFFELKDIVSQTISLIIREYRNDGLFDTHQIYFYLDADSTVSDS